MFKPGFAALALLLAASLPAQVVASGFLAAPSRTDNAELQDFSAGGNLGIALPAAPHILPLWNLAGMSFDRVQARNGGSLQTGLEAWVSPALRPAQSHGPMLLGEAAVGRRFGYGLHGYSLVGAGAGWSLGDWVPYVEFRRRAGFSAAGPVEHELVIGLHFILFG